MEQHISAHLIGYLARHIYFACTFSSMLFFTHLTYADYDKGLAKLLELSLKELMQVSVASKKIESVFEAPGIITVVNKNEFRAFGARNLRDVLDRLPNTQVVGSNLFPHNRVTMRAVGTSHLDNSILLLLNGRPIRAADTGGLHADIYQAFPLNIIERLEIIRGPGSVLYGTNAFAGVINIVTQNAEEVPTLALEVSYGSFDSKRATLTGSINREDFSFVGSITTLDREGDSFSNITDERGQVSNYETGSDGYEAVINLRWGNLEINSILSNLDNQHGRSFFAFPLTTQKWERQFFDIGYTFDVNNNWKLQSNFTYNHIQNDFFTTPTASLETEPETITVELSASGHLTDNLNLVTGFTYNHLRTDRLILPTGTTTHWHAERVGVYSQTDYQMNDWLKLVGGFQWNKPEESSSNISPRISLIANLDQQWTAKLLYGEAFRSPFLTDLNIDISTLKGNSSLKPETIKTYEAQLLYFSPGSSWTMTYYNSQHDNIHTRVTLAGVPTLQNEGKIDYWGIELEGKHELGHGFDFIGNLSYQSNEHSDNGHDDETYAPDWMIKTGILYESPHGYQLSVFNSYFAKSTLQNHQLNTVTVVNPDAGGYNLLTANLRINLGDVFNSSALSNTNFSLYGDNLLDEEIFFPSISRTAVNSLPHHDGRGFYATVSVEF